MQAIDLNLLRDEFRSKGLAGRVGFGSRPALLVVDMIRGFTDPKSPLSAPLDEQIIVVQRLLDAARARQLPIFFSTVEYRSDLADAGKWILKIPSNAVLVSGSEWVQVDARLAPAESEFQFRKQHASCFFGTGLSAQLTAMGVDTLILVGCTTSGCVRATAVDASSYGLHTIVVEEGVGDRAAAPHAMSLFDIDSKYGDVVKDRVVLEYFAALKS